MDSLLVVSEEEHDALVRRAFHHRGYHADEAADITRLCREAALHGIRTHNAIKALHLDHLFGSTVGGCVPGAVIEEIPNAFAASRVWNANRKLGATVAYRAIDTGIELARRFGIGMISVDNAWHYLWGGGYVLEAARQGFIAYTQCTAMLAEVAPFGGRAPVLGTNPHTWAFPTTKVVGFPILVDWATSAVAMGRVQQLKREGKSLPPNSALDAAGQPTTDPAKVAALLPFGAHKGYSLGLINEIIAGFIGGSLPTIRGHFRDDNDKDEKHTPCFFFLVIHPDAMNGGGFARGRSLRENLQAVIDDIRGPGNENILLPGQLEAEHAERSRRAGGLLFTRAEIDAFHEIARECGHLPLRPISP